jgi:TonB family protein
MGQPSSYLSAYHHSINRAHRRAVTLIQAVALSAVIALTLPIIARAAGEREVVSRVKPVYPELAKRMKISGTVLLHAKVDSDGKVIAVNTVMGETVLAEAAKAAVLHWKYAPAEYESTEDIEIEF